MKQACFTTPPIYGENNINNPTYFNSLLFKNHLTLF